MSTSLLVSCGGVVTHQGLYPIAKETSLAAPMLCTEFGPNGWMDRMADTKTFQPSKKEQPLLSLFHTVIGVYLPLKVIVNMYP